MAEGIGFNLEIIRDYLISEGGKVEYHKLIKHFKDALADPRNQETRVLFKDLVNKVAIVNTEGNQKFLSLRSNFIEEASKLSKDNQLVTNIQVNCNDPKNFNTVINNVNNQNKAQVTSTIIHPSSANTGPTINSGGFNVPQYYQGNPSVSKNTISPNPISQVPIYSLNQKVNKPQQITFQSQASSPSTLIYQSQRFHPSGQYPIINANNLNSNSFVNDPNLLTNNSTNIYNNTRMSMNQSNINQRNANIENINQATFQQIQSPIATINKTGNINSNIHSRLVPVPMTHQPNIVINSQQSQQPSALIAKNIQSIWSNLDDEDRPPKPPPRRKSFASSSNTYLNKKGTPGHVKDNENFPQSTPKQFTDKIKEINELKFNSPGRVKEHAKKLNKMVSESELKPPMPLGTNNSNPTNVQTNCKDDSDLSDNIKRRWMVKSSCCDYNELVQMLRDYPKLASLKDITSGYTALHWAAKFNKPDIIKLIAGTHGVSPNIKTSGYTPLHLAAMFDHREIIELLIKGYGADMKIRDYSGNLPLDICRQNSKRARNKAIENGTTRKNGHDSDTNSSGKGPVSLLARTASLRQTHRQLLDRLPSKYRTVK